MIGQKSVKDIKEELQRADEKHLEELLQICSRDDRSAVQKLAESAKKKLDALDKERKRIEELKRYEKEYSQYTYICGIDEVGRGPLAGPVVAGAVILPKDCRILYIKYCFDCNRSYFPSADRLGIVCIASDRGAADQVCV